jgi:hypothetical protein
MKKIVVSQLFAVCIFHCHRMVLILFSIIFLAAVEACLLHGLKRRAVGLFKTSTTMALLQKIAKTCPSAAEVVKIIDDDHRQNEEPSSLLSLSR